MLTHSENRKPQEFNNGTSEVAIVSGVYPFLNTEQTLQSVYRRVPGVMPCGTTDVHVHMCSF